MKAAEAMAAAEMAAAAAAAALRSICNNGLRSLDRSVRASR